MPLDEFLADRKFDPEYLAVLSKAFDHACADLGVTSKVPHARALVAKRIIQLADGQRDPEAIRATVVAFLKSHH